MKNIEIPLLTKDDIECRIATVTPKGASFLLYKDARCDMRILDEVFGIYGWQRKNELIDGQLFCSVSVQNPDTKEWISKQDVGTESYTEKEKGRASDAFKRACFNIGIGRELYTAPFIWINWASPEEYNNGKPRLKLTVKEIKYNSRREITQLVLVDNKGERFSMGNKTPKAPKPKNDDAFDLALQEIKEAKSLKDLTGVFNRWSGLQSDKEFISALTQKRQSLGLTRNKNHETVPSNI